MKKQKILFLPIIIFLLISLVPFSVAAPSNAYANSVSQTGYQSMMTGGSHGAGMSFIGNNGYLQAVTFQLKKAVGASGTVSVGVYDNTGSGSNWYPLNAAPMIDWSLTTLDLSTVSSASYGYFSFSFSEEVWFNSSRYYSVVLKCNTTVTDWLYVGISGSGFFALLGNDDTYSAGSGQIVGYVITESEPDPTPSPSPSPSPSPTPWTYQGDIWAALVPYGTLILPLILILIVALICGKYAGVWGFFAGLNIAAILVYAIMGAAYLPLWGIVMLALVDGLLLFGKISGRM